ncbi:MAG: hypothetical protein DRQ13_00570 [Ignavibacteriae bacterium]|nr:MAG: hypothetical protein DRQ13_00570 [Ignavibacteriota bacterium]
MDFYGYSSLGETDTMNTRIFTGLEATDSIKFDYAHAEYPGYGPDRLIVRVSIDGGQTYPFTIFDKEGVALATVPETSSNFVPTNSNEWATFTYSLGSIIPVLVELNEFGVPRDFVLYQNYPNPFNPSTIIKYAVSEERPVSIKIFDLTGREVVTLVNEVKQPGTYQLTFDAGKYASGVYIYQMISGDFVQVKKMSLLK